MSQVQSQRLREVLEDLLETKQENGGRAGGKCPCCGCECAKCMAKGHCNEGGCCSKGCGRPGVQAFKPQAEATPEKKKKK